MQDMTHMMYFDNAATTPMSLEALQTYEKTATEYIGNPSALHKEGLEAKALLQQCRSSIANLLEVPSQSLVFTSGATESNSIILNNLVWTQRPGQVILSGIEHPSVAEYARLLRQLGWTVTFLNAPDGFVRAEDLKAALTDQTRLVCCMLVNNVVGSIQDISKLVGIVRDYQTQTGRKIHFHTDAVQALGKIPFSLTDLNVDSASFSAHKFNGPRGIGILYTINPGLQSLSRGGEQENGLRPGTENLPAIAAMTTALENAFSYQKEHLENATEINAMLRRELSEFTILSPQKDTSPYILNLSVAPLPSEVFARILYDNGFCISSGSACSNNSKQKGETVLSSMLIRPSDAKSSIRLSLGFNTTLSEATELSSTIKSTYRKLI
jgi:cysteine desulfurase